MNRYLNIVFTAVSLLLLSCYQGHGLDPYSAASDISGIRGEIRFASSPPDSTREVRIAVFRTFPAGITARDSLLAFTLTALSRGELFFSEPVSYDRGSVEYLLQLPAGTYEWVAAVWFPDIDDYLLGVKELGSYCGESGSRLKEVLVMPGTVTPTINIHADFKHVDNESPFIDRSNL